MIATPSTATLGENLRAAEEKSDGLQLLLVRAIRLLGGELRLGCRELIDPELDYRLVKIVDSKTGDIILRIIRRDQEKP